MTNNPTQNLGDQRQPTPNTTFKLSQVMGGWKVVNEGELEPFSEIVAGVRIGFQPMAGAVVVASPEAHEDSIKIDVSEVGQSRWLTLEFDLDPHALQVAGSVVWRLTMSGFPRCRVKPVLRVWRGGPFADEALPYVSLNPVLESKGDLYLVPSLELERFDVSQAKIIFHLPLHAAVYRISKLFYGPAL